jgi:hypothetical protein
LFFSTSCAGVGSAKCGVRPIAMSTFSIPIRPATANNSPARCLEPALCLPRWQCASQTRNFRKPGAPSALRGNNPEPTASAEAYINWRRWMDTFTCQPYLPFGNGHSKIHFKQRPLTRLEIHFNVAYQS